MDSYCNYSLYILGYTSLKQTETQCVLCLCTEYCHVTCGIKTHEHTQTLIIENKSVGRLTKITFFKKDEYFAGNLSPES